MTDQSRMDSFGVSPNRPVLMKKKRVDAIRIPEVGFVRFGYRGPVPARNTWGVVRFCEHDEHYIAEDESFSIPLKVLQYLRSRDIEMVYFAEEDTGTVYEFHEHDITEPVPQRAKGTDEKDVEKRMVDIEHRRGKYENHVGGILQGGRDDG